MHPGPKREPATSSDRWLWPLRPRHEPRLSLDREIPAPKEASKAMCATRCGDQIESGLCPPDLSAWNNHAALIRHDDANWYGRRDKIATFLSFARLRAPLSCRRSWPPRRGTFLRYQEMFECGRC